jgi:hypothetical protein
VESWSPGGVHLESVGEGKLHKHQVPDIPANENNLPYTSTKLAYGSSPPANSSL